MVSVAAFLVSGVGIVAVLALLASTGAMVFGSVDRKRLERFALREALWITPGNGNTVIRYLATTRRWRGGLLYVILLGTFVGGILVYHEGDLNLLPAFCGWFVGAVIAEWRVDSLAREARGVAVLHRRRITDYVQAFVVVLARVLWLVVGVLGITAVIATAVRSADLGASAPALIAALVAGAAIVLVVRRILQRPQPVVAPDLLEADNAIRARSLNVLTGCALAIGGYFGAIFAGEIVGSSHLLAVQLAHLVGFAVLPIAGVLVARAPRAVPLTVSTRALAA